MSIEKKGLAIIFHSGAYDRLYHGLSIALAALALGRDVKLFFTYWALEYLRRGKKDTFELQIQDEAQRKIIENHISKGHIQEFAEVIAQAKAMGAKIYACTNSMGVLNIARDELVEEVGKSTGITAFLTETAGDQILFI